MNGERSLVVKCTAGAEEPERCSQAFTVAATALAAGAEVSLWLTGEAVWFGVAGRAEAFALPHAPVTVQHGQRPGSRRREEPEVAGGRRDDLGGELARGVQQPHVRAGDRSVRPVSGRSAHDAVDDGFLLDVDPRRQGGGLLG